nr:MAG TPA: hypothetical protein [Caudoviricetes sp.]
MKKPRICGANFLSISNNPIKSKCFVTNETNK